MALEWAMALGWEQARECQQSSEAWASLEWSCRRLRILKWLMQATGEKQRQSA
ncbi:MAG: hypothetical protein JWO13_2185 [Acidobacteriales bacterium]|nr:hypothetical protein [Terriglobales bacterium]